MKMLVLTLLSISKILSELKKFINIHFYTMFIRLVSPSLEFWDDNIVHNYVFIQACLQFCYANVQIANCGCAEYAYFGAVPKGKICDENNGTDGKNI